MEDDVIQMSKSRAVNGSVFAMLSSPRYADRLIAEVNWVKIAELGKNKKNWAELERNTVYPMDAASICTCS